MADLPIPKNRYEVEVPEHVKKMWMEKKIAELDSRISRMKQDITDLEKIKLVELKAELEMLELTRKEYIAKINSIEVK